MRTRQFLLTLLLVFFTTSIWADDSKIIVWFNDGTKTEIPFENMPTFTYDAPNVTITIGATSYTWALADLKEFTFEKSLPTFIFAETEDNSLAVVEKDANKCNIKLDRTLQKDVWNTFAVPFDMDAEMVTSVLGAGTKLKVLTGSSLSGTKLTMTFGDATTVEAGKPYLVKVKGNVENPTFTGITVSKTAKPTTTDYVDFIPTFGKSLITGPTGEEDNEWSVRFLGAGNTFFHPSVVNQPANDESYQKGFRAYFQLHNGASQASLFTTNLDNDATGIEPVGNGEFGIDNNVLYDLNGRRVIPSSGLQKGIYIRNGKKVVVK